MNAVLSVSSFVGNNPLAKSFDEVMAYQHSDLVARLQRKLGITAEQATALFEDTKRFLYLCGVTTCSGFSPSSVIDEGWHNFILFTKDYYEFCHTFFGRFIHHLPKNKEEGEKGGKYSAQRTLVAAQKMFGTLSANWKYPNADCNDCCEKCSPSTNCQDHH